MALSWAAERFAFLVSRRDRAPEKRKVGGSTPPLTTRFDQAIWLLTCDNVGFCPTRPLPSDARLRPLRPGLGRPLLHADCTVSGGLTMTTRRGEDWGALHERILRFMGAFSSVQFAIDNVVGLYLKRRMPDLGPELDKQLIRRIRDDQRLPLFNAFAAEAKYDGDLSQFAATWNGSSSCSAA